MSIEQLIKSFINDILDNDKKIILLIGSGMSLKNGNDDGIGDTNYYIEKFKKIIKSNFTSNQKDEWSELLAEIEKSDNPYSKCAEEILKIYGNSLGINNIFKKDIIPIIANGITVKESKDYIEHFLKRHENCKKIKLNEGFESFGKVAKYFSNNTRIFTSNFDPFIEIALRKNDIDFLQFHSSHNLEKRREISLSKQQIILEHYHGYWLNNTAHTDLIDWKHNIAEFENILQNHDSLYIFGFGGWKDSFSQAIVNTIESTENQCQVHWSFYYDELSTKERISKKTNDFNLINKIIDNLTNCKAYYEINTNSLFTLTINELRIKVVENALEEYKITKQYEIKNKEIDRTLKTLNYKYGSLDLR